jgi:hypothetical protein
VRLGYALGQNYKLNLHRKSHGRNISNQILGTLAGQIHKDQHDGLKALELINEQFKNMLDLLRGGQSTVLVGGERSGDETQQRFVIDPRMRDFTNAENHLKNLSVPTMAMLGRIECTRVAASGSVEHIQQPWLMFPMVLQGKKAPVTVECYNRFWPYALRPGIWQKVKPFTTMLLDVKNNDNGTENPKAQTYDCSQLELEYAANPDCRIISHRQRCHACVIHREWA